jgi:hypothetical protein
MKKTKKAKKGKSLHASKKLKGVKPLSVMTGASPLNTVQSGTGSGAGKVSFGEFSITKTADNASPSLFQQATGTTNTAAETAATAIPSSLTK